jgi:hypothetical protein
VTFQRFDEAALIMATLPLALAGGFWLLWLLGHNLSVAGAVRMDQLRRALASRIGGRASTRSPAAGAAAHQFAISEKGA